MAQSTAYKLPKIFPAKLLEAIGKKLDNMEFVDFHFKFVDKDHPNGRTIGVHSVIVAAQSRVFNAMIKGQMKEASEIEINDVSSEIFQILVQRMYGVEKEPKTMKEAIDLFHAAHKYECKEPAKFARSKILQMVNTANVDTAYEYATLFNDAEVRAKCLQVKVSDVQAEFYKLGDHDLSQNILKAVKIEEEEDDDVRIGIQFDILERAVDVCQFLMQSIHCSKDYELSFFLEPISDDDSDCEMIDVEPPLKKVKTTQINVEEKVNGILEKRFNILGKESDILVELEIEEVDELVAEKIKIIKETLILPEKIPLILKSVKVFVALAQHIVKELLPALSLKCSVGVESDCESCDYASSDESSDEEDYYGLRERYNELKFHYERLCKEGAFPLDPFY